MDVVGQSYVVPSAADYGIAAVKVVAFVLLLAALWEVLNAVTRFDDEVELFERRNRGYAIVRIALVFAQAIAMMPLLGVRTESFGADIATIAGWGIGILGVLLLLSLVADRLVRPGERADAGGGLPAAVAKGGFYLAFGLILNAALSGTAPDVPTAIVASIGFAALGLAALLLAYRAMGLLGPLRRRDGRSNLAGAVVRSGTLIALGLVLRSAIAGDFTGWAAGLAGFGLTFVTGFVGLIVLVWLIDLLIIRSRHLRDIITGDELLPAAVMAAMLVAVAVGVSAVVV